MTRAVFVFAFLAVAGIAAYKWAYPTFSFHVRLGVVVDDNGHEKRASSVIAFRQVANPPFGGFFSDSTIHVHGEAVYLDLGRGNNLFVLLGLGEGSQDDIVTITSNEFFSDFRAADYGTIAYSKRVLANNLGKPKNLPDTDMPTLVHFRNIAERDSIEAVLPSNAQKTLGTGVNIVRIYVELTDAPLTPNTIDLELPWLAPLIGNEPMRHMPIYHTQMPKVGQDALLFTGLRRDY